MERKTIKSALISVFDKTGIDELVKTLDQNNVKIISTGGTQKYIEELGIKVTSVEEITGYKSILGGRVKTLHPLIFGGILSRRENANDLDDMKNYLIPEIDLVIVDLYPFEETVKNTDKESEIIEKIDIGGISLIRAAAKNYKDVMIVPAQKYYNEFLEIIKETGCATNIEQRRTFAKYAFAVSSYYDSLIFSYFAGDDIENLRIAVDQNISMRYGENPHQKGKFFGDFSQIFDQLHGKQISYNNLLDISSAVDLIDEFDELTLAILKHNNACGLASRNTLVEAWKDALAGDPVSAFGGIIVTNTKVDLETAKEINKIFYEVIIAPDYDKDALEVLMSKKNRIILVQKKKLDNKKLVRSALNGYLVQDKDLQLGGKNEYKVVTDDKPTEEQIEDLLFANKIVKHSKSNSIVLAKNKQLIGSGVGQTSRVDALKQAIAKAESFGLDLKGSVMASDAFFPFADSVEIAYKAGVRSVIQPGGSIRDKDSIDYCNNHIMPMIFTGLRHFKH